MTATPQTQGRNFKTLATQAARAADEKKGEDIRLLHIRPVSSIADYLLIVSAKSRPHMNAVEEGIHLTLKKGGDYLNHREGRQSDIWKVLDYGGLLVHIMHPKAREFYALEKLFHEARSIKWSLAPAKTRKAAKPVKKPAAGKKPAVKKQKNG